MAKTQEREVAMEELETALETENEGEKDFRIRQALQLLTVDGEEISD